MVGTTMPRFVALDANLLVLMLVGRTERQLIGRHKRLKVFAPEDHETLLLVLGRFDAIHVTPNVVTEACNLARQIDEPARGRIMETLTDFCRQATEVYVPSTVAAEESQFSWLGLSDVTMLVGVDATTGVLTGDHQLYSELCRKGHLSRNFNHIWTQGWTSPSPTPEQPRT
jgi:hypothetical protein